MQAQNEVEAEALTMEILFQKSEKLRKTMWGQHAAYAQKLANTEEKLEWTQDRLARLERLVERG